MWLLPDKIRAYIRWSLDARRVSHLHPTNTIKTLTLSYLASKLLSIEEPAEAFFHTLRLIPQAIVGKVPPCHFEMEFAKP